MRDSTKLPPHKEPQFYKIILLSLISHLTILFIAFGLPFFTFKEDKTLLPTVKVDLVGLPELRPFEKKVVKPTIKEEKKVVVTKTKEKVSKIEKPKMRDDESALSEAISDIAKLKRDEKDVESSLNKGNIITTDGSDIEPYKLYLNDTIYKNWAPPLRRIIGETPRFQMFINGNGAILSVVMVKSSGNNEYDKSAEHAIKKSSPFSLPPRELQRELEKDGVVIDFIPQLD